MSEIESSFEKLLGRTPSDAERQNLYRVRDALGLKNNDALWLVLMALDHYKTLYEAIPGRIAATAGSTLENIRSAADAEIRATAEATKADLAKTVAAAARDVANHTAKKQMWKWAAGCIAVAAVAVGGVGWYANKSGHESGFAEGYANGWKRAQDDKAAASWANTPQGKRAYHLAEAGDLDALVKCTKPGWHAANGYCFASTAPDGKIYGWRLP